MSTIHQAFEAAKQRYAEFGADVEAAMKWMDTIPISIHCWQGDDVRGFEGARELSGGIQTTGSYPGSTRNADELRADISQMLSYIPGAKKLSLHAIYAQTNGKSVGRDELRPEHFADWVDFAVEHSIGLDENSTFFSHAMSGSYTLSSKDEKTRRYWVEHTCRMREISEYIGRKLGQVCIHNIWIPDGEKEIPADTLAPRLRLIESLDECMSQRLDRRFMLDSVESKLFGIGSESYVVGSHEFYMGYALSRGLLLTLDSGHFHPTEYISAKISALIPFVRGLLLHISRPVRWDSDHVAVFDDETKRILLEAVRTGMMDRIHIATDWFDASINRVFAWTIGVRNVKKALLAALLDPTHLLRGCEGVGDLSGRLAYQEEAKALPLGSVWDYYCESRGVLPGAKWIEDAREYERHMLAQRI